MRIPDSEVIPFAFYEILFLDFLEGRMSEVELVDAFNAVCDLCDLVWDIKSKLKSFMRRFWKEPYSENEKVWMRGFCCEKSIDAKERILKLWNYINK